MTNSYVQIAHQLGVSPITASGMPQVAYVLLDITMDADATAPPMPLNICLVLDQSLSMRGEKFNRVHTQSRKIQYLYSTDTEVVLMDSDSYEQVSVSPEMATEALKWVVENGVVDLMYLNGVPFSLEAPTTVELLITQTDPGFRGDTAQGGAKPATLETGVTVQVPMFIEQGERVKVDTRTGEYLSRA